MWIIEADEHSLSYFSKTCSQNTASTDSSEDRVEQVLRDEVEQVMEDRK